MNKKIIINADDFGLTSGINYGILDAYLQNSISSISLMMNTNKTLEAIEIMKRYHIDCVGIHVNITLGNPISSPSLIPSLLEENGCFHKSSWWFEKNHRVNEQELIVEFDHQITKFKELTGKMPKHINYHHRYDFYKEYPLLAKHLIQIYHVPMRLEREEEGYPYEYASNEQYFLHPHEDIKKYLQAKIVELPCHVGFVDQDIMESSSLNLQRMKDHFIVNSKIFKETYKSLGYHLVSFEDLELKNKSDL